MKIQHQVRGLWLSRLKPSHPRPSGTNSEHSIQACGGEGHHVRIGIGVPISAINIYSLCQEKRAMMWLHLHVLNVLGMQMRPYLHMQISHVPFTYAN